jgi:hypothetical protein
MDPRVAAEFVEAQIGPVLTHDRTYGTNLEHALERSIDEYPTNAGSSLPAYPHETERALELINADLDIPEVRLAIQLACRLRRGGTDDADAAPR